MAYKRKLTIERSQEDAPEEEDQPELGWRDWLLKRYARSWYWVGVIFLDIIIFLEVQRTLHLDIMLAVMLVALAIVVEFYIYARIWGRFGPLRENNIDEDED